MNIAARLGSLSAGDDVMTSDVVRRDAGVEAVLSAEGVSMKSTTTEIRGLEKRLSVRRVHRPFATEGVS